MNPRKLTPSMSLLLCFESAARHQSFTRAAEELSLTQSAVSRQVQALEELLEVGLFRRSGRKIALTEVGAMYLREVSGGLGRIRDASLQVIAHRSGGGSLHLAVLPSVATKWLLPRLPSFYARHPNILLHIHSRIGQFDLELGGMDAVISNSADGRWPGALSHKLLTETLVPVVSPRLAASAELRSARDVSRQLLLQVEARPNVWREWFASQGLAVQRMRHGPVFELTSHLIQAVAADIGVGLVARFLVQEELDTGRLVLACEGGAHQGLDYFLFVQAVKHDYPPLKAFRDWLLEQVGPDD
jgi:LysR family glycine cleavage system transcriptional activator